jgi:hypothetical protein
VTRAGRVLKEKNAAGRELSECTIACGNLILASDRYKYLTTGGWMRLLTSPRSRRSNPKTFVRTKELSKVQRFSRRNRKAGIELNFLVLENRNTVFISE